MTTTTTRDPAAAIGDGMTGTTGTKHHEWYTAPTLRDTAPTLHSITKAAHTLHAITAHQPKPARQRVLPGPKREKAMGASVGSAYLKAHHG